MTAPRRNRNLCTHGAPRDDDPRGQAVMRALEAGELEARALSLPPGSLVLLNSRTYHAVRPKPVNAEQEHRLFIATNFKEAGPDLDNPRMVPTINPEWIEGTTDAHRLMLFRAGEPPPSADPSAPQRRLRSVRNALRGGGS